MVTRPTVFIALNLFNKVINMSEFFNPNDFGEWKKVTKAISDHLRENPNSSNPSKLMFPIASHFGFNSNQAFKSSLECKLTEKEKEKYIKKAGNSLPLQFFVHYLFDLVEKEPFLRSYLDDDFVYRHQQICCEERLTELLEDSKKMPDLVHYLGYAFLDFLKCPENKNILSLVADTPWGDSHEKSAEWYKEDNEHKMPVIEWLGSDIFWMTLACLPDDILQSFFREKLHLIIKDADKAEELEDKFSTRLSALHSHSMRSLSPLSFLSEMAKIGPSFSVSADLNDAELSVFSRNSEIFTFIRNNRIVDTLLSEDILLLDKFGLYIPKNYSVSEVYTVHDLSDDPEFRGNNKVPSYRACLLYDFGYIGEEDAYKVKIKTDKNLPTNSMMVEYEIDGDIEYIGNTIWGDMGGKLHIRQDLDEDMISIPLVKFT